MKHVFKCTRHSNSNLFAFEYSSRQTVEMTKLDSLSHVSRFDLIAFAENSFKFFHKQKGKNENEIFFYFHHEKLQIFGENEGEMHCKSFHFTLSSSFAAAFAAILWAFHFFFLVKYENEHLFMVKIWMGFVVEVLKLANFWHSPEKKSRFFIVNVSRVWLLML